MKFRTTRPRNTSLCMAAALLCSLPAPLHANTYVVTQTSGTGTDTLHEAITLANAHTGPDTIDLRSVSGNIFLYALLPTITEDTTILGDGELTLHGRDSFRLLDIDPTGTTTISVEIDSVIFKNGRASGGGVVSDSWGGAIRSQGDINLTLRNCAFLNNTAGLLGGAVTAYGTSLMVENCSFIGNSATDGGAFGGFSDTGTFRNCTFTENTATSTSPGYGTGGAIILYGASSTAITHCTIVGNNADHLGGGIFVSSPSSASFSYSAMASNTSNGSASNITGDTGATLSYPAINSFAADLKLAPLGTYHHAFLPTFNLLPDSPLRDAAGGSATATDQRGVTRPQNGTPDIGAFEAKVYYVTPITPFDAGPGTLRDAISSDSDIIDMTNTSGTYTPGTALPRLDGVVIAGPGADKFRIGGPSGAPVFEIRDAAPVVLTGLGIGPSVRISGGRTGVFVVNTPFWALDCQFKECIGYEGGVALSAFDSDVKISGCCFDNNEAWIDGGALSLIDSTGLVENSTFSGNEAQQGADGGAITIHKSGISQHDASLVVNHATFYNNSAEGDGGHLEIGSTVDSVLVKNTLMLAGSAGGSGPHYHDPGSKLTSESNYFGSSASGVIDASLELNGGTTPNHRLLTASLPIDAALASGSPETDQRGAIRSDEGGLPDIGAYEFIASKYRQWLIEHFSMAAMDSGDAFFSSPIHFQDPDGDGTPNIAEFLFLMHPLQSDAYLQPDYSETTSTLFTYAGIAFRENINAPGEVAYFVQRSTNFQNWASAGMIRSPFSIGEPWGAVVGYHSSQPMGAPFGVDSEFYRVQVLPPVDASPMVYVRHPGNAADSNGRGAVTDVFRISQHEVTNTEYVRFLNAVDPKGFNFLGLFNPEHLSDAASGIDILNLLPDGEHYTVKPGFENLPVVFVDYWDAVRYVNWRHNGAAPGSDTEDGAYTLEGNTAVPSNAFTVFGRNPGARCFLPNADEWYKAAYHQGGGTYAPYPTGGSTVNNSAPPGDAESANYGGSSALPVASYPDARNYYLLYDMGGNVDEFIEKSTLSNSVLNMGGRYNANETLLHSSNWDTVSSTTEARYSVTGFRIAAPAE